MLSESDFDREPSRSQSQASVQVLQVEDKEIQEERAVQNRRSSMLQSFNNSKQNPEQAASGEQVNLSQSFGVKNRESNSQ